MLPAYLSATGFDTFSGTGPGFRTSAQKVENKQQQDFSKWWKAHFYFH